MYTTISTKNISRNDWLQMRKTGIGGSDAGAVCGLNPYSSAMNVFYDKTSEELSDFDNEAMRQGRDLEEYVARRFMEQTGKRVYRSNKMYRSTAHPFMLADIDRLISGENAGLECKTVSPYMADKWIGNELPPHYMIQCHHYMAVTGKEAWYIAAVILGQGFLYRKILRDESLIQNLTSIEEQFWKNHVLTGKMPDPDGSKACDEVLAQYFKTADSGSSIPLIGFDEKLKRRAEISELQDKLEKEKKQIEQEVKVYMEDAEKADSDRFSVSWKSVVSNRVDSKKLKADYPDIYKECVKESESRRFTVKEIA